MNPRAPLVSVLLPVYNCAEYIEEAIRSVLAQTFWDFELLVLDDGSTDGTPQVIAGLDDPRLVKLRHDNRGLPATLNRGIELARGKYVARQDADDVSLPERLKKQVDFLEANPEHGLLGTWSRILVGREPTDRMHRHPADHRTLTFEILFDSQFVHPSVMFRRSVTERVGLYSNDIAKRGPEDYDFWVRIARQFKLANIPQPLVLYREVPKSMSRSGGEVWREKVMRISAEAIAWAARAEMSNKAVWDIVALWHYAFDRVTSGPDFDAIERILIDAAERVSESGDIPGARSRAGARLDELRARYRQHRPGPARTALQVLRRLAGLQGSK